MEAAPVFFKFWKLADRTARLPIWCARESPVAQEFPDQAASMRLVAGTGGITVAPSILAFDAWVMLAAVIACLPIFLTGREIARWEGAVFLAYCVFYVAYLILAAEQHAALATFTFAMIWFVASLTLVTEVAVYLRPRRSGQP